MIRIAHEAPISIFDKVNAMTDYSYALVHLFPENEEYYRKFQKAVEDGREVILDNSIFELGEAFDADEFAHWINKLKPSWYIIPDSLENSQRTLMNLDNWMSDPAKASLPGKRIAVVQGKSYVDFVNCYMNIAYRSDVDMVAISFDYSFFERWFPDQPTKYHSWILGRRLLLRLLESDFVINRSRPHHLLGCALPQEALLGEYHKKSYIYSMDTSNPVVHGLRNIRYDGQLGLQNKESTKLFTMISSQVDEAQMEDVEYNINEFRRMWNG